ncbi:MAG: hypothetical protein AAF405_09050, partial [Pseudomonadota bacterium]
MSDLRIDMSDQAETLTIVNPPARKKLSERWFAKVGIWVFGYDRLVAWYLHSKWLRARARGALDMRSRRTLRRRKQLISTLANAPTPLDAPVDELSHDLGPSQSLHEGPSLRRNGQLKIAVFIPGFHRGKGGAEKV